MQNSWSEFLIDFFPYPFTTTTGHPWSEISSITKIRSKLIKVNYAKLLIWISHKFLPISLHHHHWSTLVRNLIHPIPTPRIAHWFVGFSVSLFTPSNAHTWRMKSRGPKGLQLEVGAQTSRSNIISLYHNQQWSGNLINYENKILIWRWYQIDIMSLHHHPIPGSTLVRILDYSRIIR